ncbi:TssN family type VI secretion system protein [Spirosoma foliorum]|uniref:TssN family type VI secretion system protein n=1 Tax=Spirosoma foliorum TaxID=2710596 RepID=A0A7G5GVV6_9BACT|nr:TssN family type VI secretion system protein [Spirosoma foliorum]QMW02998.1 TssN family type VI secretion system protein [Spirosoma foliorum]
MDVVSPFLISYILIVLLTAGLCITTIWLNRKYELMTNKRLILIALISSFVLGIAGLFGLNGLQFIPVYYIVVQVFSLLCGIFFLNRMINDMGPAFSTKPAFVVLLTGSIAGLGIILFTPAFNYLSSLRYGLLQYDLWASTSLLPFLLPVLFAYTFNALVNVPNEIYKLWYYPRHAEEVAMEGVDYYRLMLLEVQIYKDPNRKDPPIKVKARTSGDVPFGMWFQKFVDDYNHKFPNDPIQTFDDTAHEYGWLFYSLKPSLFRLRSYIDFEQTIAQNNLRENYLIVAKRVEEIS